MEAENLIKAYSENDAYFWDWGKLDLTNENFPVSFFEQEYPEITHLNLGKSYWKEKGSAWELLSASHKGNRNRLSGKTLQSIFRKLPNLCYLSLNDCGLTDEDMFAFANVEKLKTLHLYTNLVSGEGVKQITHLSELTSLNMGYTKLREEDLGLFHSFPKLNYLNISANQLQGWGKLQPSLFPLKELNIAMNKIATVLPLQQSFDLINLSISNNPISDLSPLQNLKNLQKFWAYSCRFQSIEAIAQHQDLQALYMAGTSMPSLPDLSALQKLTFARLDDCELENIDGLNGLNLIHLELHDNPLTDISSLKTLVHLNHLSLSNCGIKDISPLASLVNLSYLSLVNNELETINAIRYLTKLKNLSLQNNKIRNIYPLIPLLENEIEIYNSWSMKGISISGNPLSKGLYEAIAQGAKTTLQYLYDGEEG